MVFVLSHELAHLELARAAGFDPAGASRMMLPAQDFAWAKKLKASVDRACLGPN